MLNRRRILTVLLLAALAAGGFFAGRQLAAGGASQAKQPSLFGQIEAAQTAAATGERFQGELLGITIAPSEDRIPAAILAQRQPAGPCVSIPVSEAGALDFPRPFAPPEGFTPGQPTEGDGAWGCGDKASAVSWSYQTSGPLDTPGNVGLSRLSWRFVTADVARNRVRVQNIGGRDAVVIGAATADSLAQTSQIIFPEPFGMTLISAFNVPEASLLKFAEAAAEASR